MKPTRQRKWRRLNAYTCAQCGHKRFSLLFRRSQAQECTKCERERHRAEMEARQGNLFEDNRW